MHILLIHQYFLEKEDGGGSRFNEMAKTWVQLGHKVTVVAGMVHYNTGLKHNKYKGKFIVKDEFDIHITVYRCHVSEAYNVNFIGRLWGYFSFVFSGTLAASFKAKEKYDVVLVTSPPLFVGIIGYLVSKIKRIPLVFEIRDLWPESAIDTGVLTNTELIKLAYRFEKFIYKKAHLINTLTPAFKEILLTNKKVPLNKLIMIPNAADFTLAEATEKEFDRDKFRKLHHFGENLVIVYVGAHGISNNLIQLVEVADLLKEKPVLFLSIGEGMEKEFLVKEAKKRNLQNLRFLDAVSKTEVFKYILASDIGTSILKKVDTFKTIYSNKTFDYMSCKKPILMAIDGVSRKLVEDAEAGFYIEPENAKDFADKITYYLSNKNILTVQGENGYKYAKEHYDRTILANKYMEALKKIV